jgi:hypothetical protein
MPSGHALGPCQEAPFDFTGQWGVKSIRNRPDARRRNRPGRLSGQSVIDFYMSFFIERSIKKH